MIFQNTPIDNSEALAEALTAAETVRQELAATQAKLERANAELADAEDGLRTLGAEWEGDNGQV